jgi:hypothetical protein
MAGQPAAAISWMFGPFTVWDLHTRGDPDACGGQRRDRRGRTRVDRNRHRSRRGNGPRVTRPHTQPGDRRRVVAAAQSRRASDRSHGNR